MSEIVLLRETKSVTEMARNAISAITDGNIDPITAHINLSRMEAAIQQVKADERVKDITLRELAKYGKKRAFGDCTLEECEAGVRYDYSMCNDDELAELESMKREIEQRIKARQATLKALPISGLADPNTGAMIYPPAKSSKTTIKTTFNKQ